MTTAEKFTVSGLSMSVVLCAALTVLFFLAVVAKGV